MKRLILLVFLLSFLILCCSGSTDVTVKTNAPVIEDVAFINNGDTLKGTLEIPEGKSPHPLMVLIHGSGRTTRSAYQGYYNKFYPEGYAIFRYDKRGVGESGGIYTEVPASNSSQILPLLAADADAAVQLLKKHEHIDSTQIILIGASQAGWIIPVTATLSHNIAFNILVVSPTVTVGIENYYSYLTERTTYNDSVISALLKTFKGVHGFDPVPYIKEMTQPSLWLLGGKDRSIPTKESVDILNSIIAGENKPFEIKYYPDADHGLRSNGIQEPYLDYISEWLQLRINY